MKSELTREESRHLIDLGVPREKARKVVWKQIRNAKGDIVPKEEQYRGVSDKPFSAWKVGFESFSTDDIFTITDLLEILPKVMYKDGLAYDYNLALYWEEDMKLWRVVYDAIGDNISSFDAPELIDALYQLACWYYGEYLKSEGK